jgi:hypothetical protein
LRRIKMIMGIAAVLVGMLALNAGPAMADDLDGFFIEENFSSDDARFSGDDFIFVDEGTTTLDELCSPGLSDGIVIPGCIFSDATEADGADAEEVIFFVEDIDFDNDLDFNDFDNDDNDFDFSSDFNDDNDFDFNDHDNDSRSGNFVR